MSSVSLTPLESGSVKVFLPANTWTEVILLSQTPINSDVYACSTEAKLEEKIRIRNLLSKCYTYFHKIDKFRFHELVAVEIDGKWHRGKLLSFNEFLPDDMNTTIELIDDGCFYTTNFENIFASPFSLGPLALFIKFKNFIPKTRKLIVKPLFSESLLSNGFVFVDVKLEDSDYIKQHKKQIVEKGIFPSLMNVVKVNKNTTLKNDIEIKQPSSLKNKDPVYLKYFKSNENIYVLRAADMELFNETIIRIVEKSKPKKKISIGDIVKVVYDNAIYRARITKIGLSLINVTNIDLGYAATVNKNCVYELSDNLQKMPCILFKIGIKEPILENTEELSNFIRDSEKVLLYLEFDENDSNGCGNSILRRTDNSENIFDEFLRTFDVPVVHCISNDQNNEILKVEDKITADFQSVNLENGDYCLISHFESLDSIYVCKAVKRFDNSFVIIDGSEVIIKTLSIKDCEVKINLSVGDFVKVYSSIYCHMCRATIIDIIDNDKVLVFCIDFGNKEIVPSSSIFELSDELKNKTNLPLKVAIKVPLNVNKTVEIENVFANLIDNCIFLSINFETKNSAGPNYVTLKEFVSGKSVNEEILKLFCVLPVENKIPLKNYDVCILSYFENFDCIYVLKKETNYLQVTFDTSKSLDRVPKQNLEEGNLVKVFSPCCEDLYRAEVMNRVDKENVKVHLIDFGSSEIIPITCVFELSENLRMKPGLAIKVGMKMPNNFIITEEIKQLFVAWCKTLEPLSIEFDDSCEKGLQNCTFKVLSSNINLIDEILKSFNQSTCVLR